MSKLSTHDPEESARRIESGLADHPHLVERIHRALLILLHSRGLATVDSIHARARGRARRNPPAASGTAGDNVQIASRWDELEKRHVQEITREEAARILTPEEIDDVVNLALKREKARTLEEIANLSTVSFGLIAEKVKAFCDLPKGQTRIPESEALAVRVALIRHFISDQLEFIGVAKRFLTIRDFEDLVDRVVGTDSGIGRIGGKAAGLFLAERILRRAQRERSRRPFDLASARPESFFLRSDVIEQFLDHAGLVEFQSHKYKSIDEIHNEYPMILEVFKNAEFPPAVVERLGAMLERIGPHPLIVRSSSLLEDRFGAAFAGKYRSVFLTNQGDLETRLTELLGAIAEVYASTLHADPISYRKKHNLLDYDENMAVLIQKVVGTRYRHYFLPAWAGVGFSLNEYRRNPRIRPEDGLARIVFGLGTRAVDRVSADWARMVPLGMPTLRPEVKSQDIWRYSQREVDVLNLRDNRFESLPLTELLEEEPDFPGLDQVVSIMEHGFDPAARGDPHLRRPGRPGGDLRPVHPRLALSRLPALGPERLEEAYGCPVDIEFAHDGREFLPAAVPPAGRPRSGGTGPTCPTTSPPRAGSSRPAATSTRGSVHGIEYVVLIDPRDYNRTESSERKLGVARVVRLTQRTARGPPFHPHGPGTLGHPRSAHGRPRRLRRHQQLPHADRDRPTRGRVRARGLVRQPLLPGPGGVAHPLSRALSRRGRQHLRRRVPPRLAERAAVPAARGRRTTPTSCGSSTWPRSAAGLLLNVDMDGEAGEALGYLAERR